MYENALRLNIFKTVITGDNGVAKTINILSNLHAFIHPVIP